MTEVSGAEVSPHARARMEIDHWRIKCIDEYCKSERTVGDCLTVALSHGKKAKLRRQAGQRLDDAYDLFVETKHTARQKDAFEKAFVAWRLVEDRRAFFTHGCAEELLDKRGRWVTTLSMVMGTAKRPDETVWCVSKTEAHAFLEELKKAGQNLSQQLGQLKARVKA